MATPNFTSALDKAMDTIEKPKPVPTGTYLGQIVGVPKQRELKGKDGSQTNVLDFNIRLVDARQVDDPSQLASFDLQGARPVQKTIFYDTDEGMWALKQFLTKSLGLDTKGKSVKECCAEAIGKQLLVTIGHRVGNTQDGEAAIFSSVTSTAAI